jgi:hypothetical protein
MTDESGHNGGNGKLSKVTTEEEDSDASNHEYLGILWEKYFVTGESKDLANFIESGGEIDDNLRCSLIRFLRGDEPKIHGNKTVWEDLGFYVNVKSIQAQTVLRNNKANIFSATKKRRDTEEKSSLDSIFADLSNEHLTERGAKEKYSRGRLIARSRLGIGFSWKDGYDNLRSYRESEGNCCVPVKYCTEDGFSLGIWVRSQRHQTLTSKHVGLLEKLGFLWDENGDPVF